jgi:DNA-binding transcriptional ArsR family regulator
MAKYKPHATDPLTATLAALADPTRRAILERLAGGEATVNTLAKPLKMSLPGVSKHIKVLQKAGLIVQGRDAPDVRVPPVRDVDQTRARAPLVRRAWNHGDGLRHRPATRRRVAVGRDT